VAITKHKVAFFAAILAEEGKLSHKKALAYGKADKIDGPWPRSANEPPPGGKYPAGGSQNIRPMRTVTQALLYNNWQPMEALFETQKNVYGHNVNEFGSFPLYESWGYAGPWVANHYGKKKALSKLAGGSRDWLRCWVAHAALSSIWFRPDKVDIIYRGEKIPQDTKGMPAQPPYIFSAGTRYFFSKPKPGGGGWYLNEQPSTSLLHWILSIPGRKSPGRLKRERGKELEEGAMIAHRAIEILTGKNYEQDLPAGDFGITEEERQGILAFIMSNGQEGQDALFALAGDWRMLAGHWTNRVGDTYVQAISQDRSGTKPACMIAEANAAESWVGLHLPVRYTSSHHTRASGTVEMGEDDRIRFLATSTEGYTTKSRWYPQGEKFVWDAALVGGGGGVPPVDPPDDDDDDDDIGDIIGDIVDKVKDLDIDRYMEKLEAIEEFIEKLGGLAGIAGKIEKLEKQMDRLADVLEAIKAIKGIL
jgi:hypothetical protein